MKERLYLATLSLVKGDGDVKDRLESAASSHLVGLVRREFDDLPETAWQEYLAILDQLTSRPEKVKDEGKLHATIHELTDDEARRLAERIFNLYVQTLHGAAL